MMNLWDPFKKTLTIVRDREKPFIADSAISVLREYEWIDDVRLLNEIQIQLGVTERAFSECVDKDYAPISDTQDSTELTFQSELLIEIIKPAKGRLKIDSDGLIHQNKKKLYIQYKTESGLELTFKAENDHENTITPLLPNGEIIHPLAYQLIKLTIAESRQQADLYRKFEKIKRKISESNHLRDIVELNTWLEKKNFYQCKSIAPEVVINEHGNFDFKTKINAANLLSDKYADDSLISNGSLRTPDGDFVILTQAQEETAKRISEYQQMSKAESFRIVSRPHELVPESAASDEEIDLSNFSPRLLGFEEVTHGVYFDRAGQNSGIQWINDVNSMFLFLPLGQKEGEVFGLEISDKEEAQELLNKCEQEVQRARMENRPIETIEHRGIRFEPTESRIDGLKRITGHNPAEKEPTKKGKFEAAIVSSLEAEKLPSLNTFEIDVETILQSHLRPEKKLLPHQLEAIQWLYNSIKSGRTGAQLCDDMGLGKTLTLLAFIRLLAAENSNLRCLVVCPIILMSNWEKETEEFFNLRRFELPSLLHGVTGTQLEKTARSSWMSITNYESLLKNQKLLAAIPFDVVILDESQRIKNPDAATSRICRALNRKFLITSTGTPVENRMLDLWTQTDAVMRDFHPLGSRDEFENRERENRKQENLTQVAQANSIVQFCRNKLNIHNQNKLIMHRKKIDVLKNLLPKHYLYHELPMTDSQIKIEDSIKRSKAEIFSKLFDLQKLYQHPAFLNKELGSHNEAEYISMSPKLEWLIEQISKNWHQNEKTLIFILHKEMQIRVAEYLSKTYGTEISIINGDTNAYGAGRALEKIKSFSSNNSPAMVLSPIAAGAGLNITSANHVIHFHRWWNPAKENQATDRAYRIGQKKEVFVHYPILVSKRNSIKSFDEKLNDLIRTKLAVADDFLKPIDETAEPFEEIFSNE